MSPPCASTKASPSPHGHCATGAETRGTACLQPVFRRSTTVANPLHTITYYSQNYYEAGLRGRLVFRFYGDAGNNFNPLNLKLYLQSSTDPPNDEVTLSLVKERTYWKTAVQIPDTFRPETGTGGDVATRTRTGGNTLRYNPENGDSNFLFVTEDSLVPRYIPEDNVGRHVRGRIVWEMNETTRALLQNYNSSYWFVMGDSGSNPFVIASLPDWVTLVPFIKVGNRTGLLYGHPFQVGNSKVSKGLAAVHPTTSTKEHGAVQHPSMRHSPSHAENLWPCISTKRTGEQAQIASIWKWIPSISIALVYGLTTTWR